LCTPSPGKKILLGVYYVYVLIQALILFTKQKKKQTQDLKLPNGRERMACASFNQKMYLFGGLDARTTVLQDTWKYDFSPAFPPIVYVDCSDVRKKVADPASGFYWVNFNKLLKFEVYCDMETDGGGWMLVSTQMPNGELSEIASSSFIYEEDIGYNQKLSQSALDGIASLGPTQIMVEENPAVEQDTENGLVMVSSTSIFLQFHFRTNAN
jgi:hypothetical protein